MDSRVETETAASESSSPTTKQVYQEELMYGDADSTQPPYTQGPEWNKFFKYYQVVVLLILLAAIGLLLFFDSYISQLAFEKGIDNLKQKDYFDKILPVIVPIFTFLLGMSTKGK